VTAAELAQRTELRSAVDDRTLEILERRQSRPAARRRGWLVRRMLLLADVTGLLLAFVVAEVIFGSSGSVGSHVDFIGELLLFVLTIPVWVVVAKLYGLYDRDEERTDHSTVDEVSGVFHLVTIGTWLVFAGSRLVHVGDPDLLKVSVFWATAIASISLARVSARAFCRRHISYVQNTVIVGTGEVGQTLARKLLQHPEYGINLVGFVDVYPKPLPLGLDHLSVLGDLDDLPEIVRLLDIERVIVSFTRDTAKGQLAFMRTLAEHDVQIDVVPRFFQLINTSIDLHAVEGLPLMGLRPARLARSTRLLKRALDLILTAVALVLLAPLFVLVAVAIKLDSQGPVFFRQTRVGLASKPFRIWKFRTMQVDADERKAQVAHLNKHLRPGGDPRMFKIENDPRVTRLGGLLRRSSLDELPQLFNVLRGEMSLVGPRPLILEEDAHVTDWAQRRLDLKPGITGVWQVLGRDGIPFEEMVRLDYLYVTSWSLGGDLRLLLRTVPSLLRGV
jgi:exopolysaccharide biosynthesis polyprenyl glycosylphosphotransferase